MQSPQEQRTLARGLITPVINKCHSQLDKQLLVQFGLTSQLQVATTGTHAANSPNHCFYLLWAHNKLVRVLSDSDANRTTHDDTWTIPLLAYLLCLGCYCTHRPHRTFCCHALPSNLVALAYIKAGSMADVVNGNEPEEELVDYEEEEAAEPDQAAKGEEGVKRGHVALHTAGFKEFLLKPEILRAITNNAFEHPSEGVCSDLMEL